MTEPLPLRRILTKLSRSKLHVREVNQLIEGFLDLQPSPFVSKSTLYAPGDALVKSWIRISDQPPLFELSDALGDALHNLRATLDHLIWEMGTRHKPIPVPLPEDHVFRKLQFPIFLDPDKFAPKKASGAPTKGGGARDMLRGLEPGQVTRIDALQPYGDPDAALWLLADLNNIDKHRHPHFGAGVHRVSVTREPSPSFPGFRLRREYAHKGGPVKNGTLVARMRVRFPEGYEPDRIETYVNVNLERTFGVVLGKGPGEGREVREVLRTINRRVHRIVREFTPDVRGW